VAYVVALSWLTNFDCCCLLCRFFAGVFNVGKVHKFSAFYLKDAVASSHSEKAQQGTERGFRFLKDPLFFASSVFLKTPKRIAVLGIIMALCLLVYNLAQRQLRKALSEQGETIPNQLGKQIVNPTLRWVFQCFMAVHLVTIEGVKQIINFTDERRHILKFFSPACQSYYLLLEPDP
jgi:hypothetical protein